MRDISERFFDRENFLILPSVDDLTVLADSGKEENLKMFTTMVRYVNSHGLKPSNVLADHPYRYSAKSGVILEAIPSTPDSN